MTKNEHGVYVGGYEEIRFGDHTRGEIVIRYGQGDNGMWGYAFDISTRQGGQACSISEASLRHVSQQCCFDAARKEIVILSAVYGLPQKTVGEILDRLGGDGQMELF